MRPPAYEGSNSYVFISYAHKDKDRVYPVLNNLIGRGLRLWFDEALPGSVEWDEEIARHIKISEGMISFLSNNYVESQNCRDELKYARKHNKRQLLIYMEKAVLSDGMEMRMSTNQAIKMDLSTPAAERKFYAKVLECPFVAKNLREAEDGK